LKYKDIPNIYNVRTLKSLTYYKEPTSLIKELDSKASPYYSIRFRSSNINKLCSSCNNRTINARNCINIDS